MSVSVGSSEALAKAIAALEAQRAVLGDAVIDAALAPLRQQLADQQAAAPRRRLVSVLFLDVVGSTALSQSLDPEDVLDIMDSALQSFSAVVERHGGKVLQYAGDSVLAAFGGDVAREDDAERAVRAGLDLLAEADAQATRVQREHGQGGFGIRVGVHTGQVLLGGGVDEEGTIRGFTVNIAARLEQSAPPGRLRISQSTWHHVRGVFDVEAQTPLQVKGQDEPLHSYLVLRARPRVFRVPMRGIDGAETPLVGRERELTQLVAAFEDTMRERRLHAVTVLADAGLGKSRLMHELQHRLETHAQTCWLLLGRSQPGSQLQPYGLLRDVLAWRLQIADSDTGESARQRLVEGVAPLFAEDGELQAELLGQLIGMDFSASPRLQGVLNEARLLRDRAFVAFTGYVQRLAASDGSPVVMLLDDLHWADDASLDWLQQLQKSSELPLLLVMGARPALLERRPAWGEGEAPQQRIALTPLGDAQRRALTSALLSRLPDAPESLRTLIETQAEGNPFYAEELVKMLIDDGVIVVEGQAWRVLPDRLREARIPGTLTGVLQARLDALSTLERRALQMASVVGPVFWDDALRTLDPAALPSLPALQRKAMVEARTESAFSGTREESFQHHLLHQVTYDTVLRAERRDAHARTAAWLAERVGDREAEYLAVTAEHYDRAGDKTRAVDWYWRAAQAANRRFATDTALSYMRRLLAMPELSDPSFRFKVVHAMSLAYGLLAQREQEAEALREALALADRLGDDALRAMTLTNQALLADRNGDRVAAQALAAQGAALADSSGAFDTMALAHGELAWLANERGEFATAQEQVEIGLRAARRAAEAMRESHHDLYEIQLLLVAASIHVTAHDPDRRAEALEKAVRLVDPNRHQRVAGSCHEFLAELAMELCDPDTAARHIGELDTLARLTGVAMHAAKVPAQRADLALLLGDYDEALLQGQAAELVYARIGNPFGQAASLVQQAEALARMDDVAASREALTRALQFHESISAFVEVRVSRLLIADSWRAEGDVAHALAAVQAELPEIRAIHSLGATQAALRARMATYRVLAAANDPEAAHQLELAMHELEGRLGKNSGPAARARLLEGHPLHREIGATWHAQAR
jgi:predicted ATPase/class 3 adenylate cyclase